jgi:hypothetical protein
MVLMLSCATGLFEKRKKEIRNGIALHHPAAADRVRGIKTADEI